MISKILNSEDIDLLNTYFSNIKDYSIECLPFENININGESIFCELIIIYNNISIEEEDIKYGIIFKYNGNLYGDVLDGDNIHNFTNREGEKGINNIQRKEDNNFIKKCNDNILLLIKFYILELKIQGVKETLLEYINNNVGKILSLIVIKIISKDEVFMKYSKINKLLKIRKEYKNILDVAKDITSKELNITKGIKVDKKFFNSTFNYIFLGKT